jgi:DNA polymerase I-like protein with 3'-5' exonuclease and polymerase domains
MNINYYVDLETTVNGGPDGDSPEAHWLNNKVLLCGWQRQLGAIQINQDVKNLCHRMKADIHEGNNVTIVAHNAKFDLKYLMRDCPAHWWTQVDVWDTMTWDYLASGHERKFTSLMKALDYYGITYTKTLDLGALLASGVKMENIPILELSAYLKDDVSYLFDLWRAQSSTGYVPFMNYLLPLCEMELNGLPIDRIKCATHATNLTKDTGAIHSYFVHQIQSCCEWQDGTPIVLADFSDMIGTKSKCIKPMSNRTLSFLLFGEPTDLKVTPKWHVVYKQGYSPVYTTAIASKAYGTVTPGAQGYPMSEDDLVKVQKVVGGSGRIEKVLDYRSKNKLLGTYLAPFLATSKVQGAVYPKLNTTITNTGRLSSSNPNGQNCPPPARACVGPDKDGDELTEIDFSQLEMVGAATLSGDPQMIKDINDGEDLHYNTGRSVMGWTSPTDMVSKDRKLVKNVNFGLLYGGKANGLSQQTGVEKGLVQDLIDGFYKRYPRVATWQKELFKQVVDNMKPHDIRHGEQRYASMYRLPESGRRFLFVEADSPSWLRKRTGRAFSFSPQHTANYPIQGFAGGDLVMYALYWLWVVCRSTPELHRAVKFRMTVHDSILMQTELGLDLTKIVEQMCKHTAAHFNLPVPLHCDITTGIYWQ